MGETVGAIGYKADVPSRAKEQVAEKADAARARVSEAATRAREAVAGTTARASDAAARVGDATPSGGQVKRQARRAAGLAQENPLGLAVGAAALGFLAGLALPSTRVEDERLGPVANQVKDRARETGQEALQRGKEVAQEAAGAAAETARQRGQEHGQDLAASARQNAQEVGDQARQRTTGP
jgi:vacuolar-type H+-ATPase subunit H